MHAMTEDRDKRHDETTDKGLAQTERRPGTGGQSGQGSEGDAESYPGSTEADPAPAGGAESDELGGGPTKQSDF